MDKQNKRNPNFSSNDRSLLLKIVNTYRTIIECKKTDATTWKEKNATWERIENKFNSCTMGPHRTHKQLKYKYEAIKKELKKQHSQHMSYVKGTGGGPYVPPPAPPLDEEEKILAETIVLSIQGLQNNYDSDGISGTPGVIFEDINVIENEVEYVDTDWSQPHAKLLNTELHPALNVAAELTNNESEFNYENNQYKENSPPQEQNIDDNDNIPGTANKITNKQKSGPWQSRRRPIFQKKKCISSAGAKFEIVAEKKCELIEIEKTIAKEKLVQNRREHERRMKLLELQEEEQKLKIEILKRELLQTEK